MRLIGFRRNDPFALFVRFGLSSTACRRNKARSEERIVRCLQQQDGPRGKEDGCRQEEGVIRRQESSFATPLATRQRRSLFFFLFF
jgi:hypothetical protein